MKFTQEIKDKYAQLHEEEEVRHNIIEKRLIVASSVSSVAMAYFTLATFGLTVFALSMIVGLTVGIFTTLLTTEAFRHMNHESVLNINESIELNCAINNDILVFGATANRRAHGQDTSYNIINK